MTSSSEARSAAPAVDTDAIASLPAPLAAELESAAPGGFELGALVARLRRWTGILAAFASAQALVQAATLAAGLILVNVLPVEEFAIYTFASSVLVTLSFATDLGGSSALLHFFHRSRTGEVDFAPHAAAVASLRGRLFLLSAPVAALALVSWGGARGIAGPERAATVALVLGAVALQIPATFGLLRLRLEDRFGESYRAEIAGALARLAAVAVLIAAGWTRSVPALATALAGVAVTAWLTRGVARPLTEPETALRPARRAVLRYLAPTLPGAIFFAVQGQLVIWLAATFGGTRSIAEVGALGRIGLIVGAFSTLSAVVLLPKLAASPTEEDFRRRYAQALALLVTVSLVLIVAGWIAPWVFLALLGKSYSLLEGELLIVLAASGANLVGGFAVAVNNARSWTRWQVVATVGWVVFQALLATVLRLDTLDGLLRFGLYSATFTAGGQLVINTIGLYRPSRVLWR